LPPHPPPPPHLSDPRPRRGAPGRRRRHRGLRAAGEPRPVQRDLGVRSLVRDLATYSTPSFSAGPQKHLYHQLLFDEWHLGSKPFDPASDTCPVARIPAAGGPVPTGARAWMVHLGKGGWVQREVTARESMRRRRWQKRRSARRRRRRAWRWR
jgi:hypothetical protein